MTTTPREAAMTEPERPDDTWLREGGNEDVADWCQWAQQRLDEQAAAESQIRVLENLVARRPALDKPTLYENVAHAISVAGQKTDECVQLERKVSQLERRLGERAAELETVKNAILPGYTSRDWTKKTDVLCSLAEAHREDSEWMDNHLDDDSCDNDAAKERTPLRERVCQLEQQLTADAANERTAFERLSLALTKGNASEWEHVFHAAEHLSQKLAEREQVAAEKAHAISLAETWMRRALMAEEKVQQLEAENATLREREWTLVKLIDAYQRQQWPG